MTEQAVFPNHNPTGQPFGTRLSALEVITRHAPRPWKETGNSPRGRYSMQCPLPGHTDSRDRDDGGSFSVDAKEEVWHCFGCAQGGNAHQLQQILSGGIDLPPVARQPHTKKSKAKSDQQDQITGVTLAELAASGP